MVEPKPLSIHYEVDIDLYAVGRCSKCKEKIKVTDIINIDDENIFIEVEPHNCKT